MGRGVSAGGGQSSLGYLFGGGEAPNAPPAAPNSARPTNADPSPKTASGSQPAEVPKQIPAGTQRNNTNNYQRTDGQNCGNFITVQLSLFI